MPSVWIGLGQVLQWREMLMKSKVVAGTAAILMGGLGVHKFYLGYYVQGLLLLTISVIGFYRPGFVINAVIGVVTAIEGIIYLVKTDDEFHRTYVEGRKPWF